MNTQTITGKTNIHPMTTTDKLAVAIFWGIVIMVAIVVIAAVVLL